MEMTAYCFFALVFGVLSLSLIDACSRSKRDKGDKTGSTGNPPGNCSIPCGTCCDPINVTILATNVYQEPFFENINSTVSLPPQPLIRFLEVAATQNPALSFTATFFSQWGYFIDAINDVFGSTADKTYWQILNGSLIPLDLGVSSYIPVNGDQILFNFTTWATDDSHSSSNETSSS